MSCKLAVVGANSAVGEMLLEILAERQIACDAAFALSPEPHDEEEVTLNRKTLSAERLADFDFSRVDLVFFVDDQDLAVEHAPRAADAGALVIDCSPHFRAAEDVPLVIPEVNGDVLEQVQRGALIASPSPAAIFLSLILKPLMAAATLRRVSVSSLQPVSGRGKPGVDELAGQTARLLNGRSPGPEVFPAQVAFNLLPQTSDLSEEGYSAEEMDLVTETKRLLGGEFLVNPTCIRAPVFYAHSEIISVEADAPLAAGEVSTLLDKAPGLKLNRSNNGGPTPVQHATGEDLPVVGRIRQSPGNDREVNLWCVGDNLRKGAALNAVQIAEMLIKTHL